MLKNFNDATEDYRFAIQSGCKEYSLLQNYALILNKKGIYAAAYSIISIAISENPKNARLYSIKGDIATGFLEIDSIIKYYNIAISLNYRGDNAKGMQHVINKKKLYAVANLIFKNGIFFYQKALFKIN
jgi:tetratricopeptide (TPR) repeat protein